MPPSPTERDPLAIACELVGRFLFHFSHVEGGIDAAIAKLFDLKEDAADIITANMDMNRKLNIVQSMVDLQSKPPEWRSWATDLLNQIRGLNSPSRQIVAHSTFEPFENGSVRFKRTTAKETLKRDAPVWSTKKFNDDFLKLEECATKLTQLVFDLSPYRGGTYFILGF
jgi:hypothetical protein